MAVIDVFLTVVKAVVIVYDVVTFPVYYMLQQSWQEKTKQKLGMVKTKNCPVEIQRSTCHLELGPFLSKRLAFVSTDPYHDTPLYFLNLTYWTFSLQITVITFSNPLPGDPNG